MKRFNFTNFKICFTNS